MKNHRVVWSIFVGFLCVAMGIPGISLAQQTKRPFTVADEIGLALFEELDDNVLFSPDGNYFALRTERGQLELNRVEDSLVFYVSKDVENFLTDSGNSQPPSPVWKVTRSGKQGGVIGKWRWLADSAGVAFLERNAEGNQRLVLADVRKKSLAPLTLPTEAVGSFDVRDRQYYVYTVGNPAQWEKSRGQVQAAVLGTGRPLPELLFPDDRLYSRPSPQSYLWAVVRGERFEVKHDGALLAPEDDLVLSPDGRFVVTKQLIPEVPPSWKTLYPPPYASDPNRIQGGKPVHEYVCLDLRTGSLRVLTDAPYAWDAGMWETGFGFGPSWSSDGQSLLLPATYLKSKDDTPSRPCIAVVDIRSDSRNCVEMLKGHTETGVEEGFHFIKDARFADGDKDRVIVIFMNRYDWSIGGTTEYRRTAEGSWEMTGEVKGEPKRRGLDVSIKQGINEPPLLVATYEQKSRVIWDPNPQLKSMELGDASVYKWKDKDGRDWTGGLFWPVHYMRTERYPLVIQTHNFLASEFRPSGVHPTAFAARALAAAGIMVLQVDEHCPARTPREGPCGVSGYEAAANQLVAEGLVDASKIGIIGFSYTCFYVMEALTSSSLHFKAASITDGVTGSYLQYMFFETVSKDFDSMIGARPFGEGLQQWLKRSPGFHLDKIDAPLLVVAEGPASLLGMWEPYAGLRYLQKPVDLIMLKTHEHVLTNPAVRMASQGGSVDWFRFWLQGCEDPDPAKKEQYERWRRLKSLQDDNERKAAEEQSTINAAPAGN